MKRLNVGVIGCGKIARTAHIPSYQHVPEARLSALCDVDHNLLHEVGQKFGVQRRFTDYNELLCDDSIDAVSICTPPFTHSEIAIAAAKAGKHILCEKPIACNLEDADAVIRATKNAGVTLMVGHNYRFLPNHQKVKKLLEKRIIGTVSMVRAQIVAIGPLERSLTSFYFQREKGGGVLFDLGLHLADLLLWMFGDVESVSAVSRLREGTDIDNCSLALLRFKNGLIGEINACYVPLEHWNSTRRAKVLEIVGTEGLITSDIFGPAVIVYSKKSFMCRLKGELTLTPATDPRLPFTAFDKSYVHEIESFVRSTLNRTAPPVTGEDGKKALEVILAVYRSAEDGSTVILKDFLKVSHLVKVLE